MKYVYVAGPLYGSGHQDNNIRVVLEYAAVVKELGHTPFVPHLYFFWNLMYRHPRQFWLDLDRDWLRRCDVMLRLEGKSPGATLETKWCMEFNVPSRHLPIVEPGLLRIEQVRDAIANALIEVQP